MPGIRKPGMMMTRILCALAMGGILCLLCSGRLLANYQDDSVANDGKLVYDFLDKVEAEVGSLAFDAISFDHALLLARKMGEIDRLSMTPKGFLDHVKTAEAVRSRFYKASPLTDEVFQQYLLPLRIGYEYTRDGWLPQMSAHFSKVAGKSVSADEGAKVLLGWISANCKVIPPKEYYLLPESGVQDSLAVLKGRRGSEVDLSVFTVAAFRSVGICARLVWTPILSGEAGGKMWVEYRNEAGEWIAWVPSSPSLKKPIDPRMICKGKAAVVLANPEKPEDITGSYNDLLQLEVTDAPSGLALSVMVPGRSFLCPVEERSVSGDAALKPLLIGRAPFVLAVTLDKTRFFMLNVKPEEEGGTALVRFQDGKPVIEMKPGRITLTKP